MTLLALPYPQIDPVLVEIGPFAIRWYALAYVAGLFLGWRYILRLNAKDGPMTRPQIDDLFVWVALGVLLGGRLGYVLFYDPAGYFADPIEIVKIWKGGMSFHGGFLGVAVALILFCWQRKVSLLRVTDLMACTAPIGLFLGRLANFINGELYGRVTDLPWGMVFPGAGDLPRHPSQLYEATLEGLVLFVLLGVLFYGTRLRKKAGLLTGVFLLGYGLFRALVELVRQPDALFEHGTVLFGLTMGQLLSLPMVAGGLFLIHFARTRPVKVKGHGRG